MIATESFRSGKDIYFFDYLKAVNGRHYLRIARLENRPDRNSLRSKVVVFEDVIQPMISAFAYLLHVARYADKSEVGVMEICNEAVEQRMLKEHMDSDMSPRDRLLLLGADSLSEMELLSLMLGFGCADDVGENFAAELMEMIAGDLGRLSAMKQADFCRMSGVGKARSCLILASVELGRRCFTAAPISYSGPSRSAE